MGTGKPNNEDNPPASTSPLQENDEFAFTVRRDGAADCSGIFHNGNNAGIDLMSFPYMSPAVAPSPWQIMHGTYQSRTHDIPENGGNLMADFTKLNSLPNPQIDPNSINIGSNIPGFLKVSEILCPEGNMKGIHQPINHDNMVTAANVMNGGASFSSLQHSQINRNFVPLRGNAAGGYQITRQGGEAKGSNINRPQINGNFVRLGCGTPMLCHSQNSGERDTDKDVKVSAVQFGCPEKIDGSFLTLGIGGNTEARSRSNFNSREIASKLEEAVSPHLNSSHIQQSTISSTSLDHNLAGGFSRFQSNAGGFSSPGNMGGWTSSNNDVGVIRGANTGPSSSPSHILQTRQVDMQHNFFMPSNRNSGFVGERDARCADLDPYKGFQGDWVASPGPFSSSSSGFLSSRQTGLSELASQSANPAWITTQPTSDQLLNCYMKTAKNFSPASSMNSPFLPLRGSSARQDHSGQLSPALDCSATQSVESGQFPRRIGVQPAGQQFSAHKGSGTQAAGRSLFPKRIGVQVTEGSTAQAATGGQFPKRLGVQVNGGGAAQAAEGGLLPKRMGIQITEGSTSQATECRPYLKAMGVQAASNLHLPHDIGPVQFHHNLLGPPFAIGRPQDGVPVQFSFRGSSSTTGQLQDGVPVQFSKDLLRPASTTGQVIPLAKVNGLSQASNVLGRPSLKRSAIHPPPAAPWVQRRKITPQPTIHPPMRSPQRIAPASIPIPAPSPPHIRWQGFNGLPQSTGQKCLLCKRDLSFTPEGPIHQPTVRPAVAVLPCGHTFHDHCLQIITPEDQSKNPPCIPCAVGET